MTRVILFVNPASVYARSAKFLVCRLARETDIDYEVNESKAMDKNPLFVINDKIKLHGIPSLEELKSHIDSENRISDMVVEDKPDEVVESAPEDVVDDAVRKALEETGEGE